MQEATRAGRGWGSASPASGPSKSTLSKQWIIMPSLWSETLGARRCPPAPRSRVWGAQNLGPGRTAPVIRPHLDPHRHTEPEAHQLTHQSLHFNTSQGDSKAPKLEQDRACSPPGGLTRGPLCRMPGAGGSWAPGVASMTRTLPCTVPTHQAPQGQSDNSYQLWVLLRAVLVLGNSCTHTHYTCVYIYVCACYMCAHTCMLTHIHIYMCVHVHSCKCAHAHACACICMTYTCTHMCTHMSTLTQTCTHERTPHSDMQT